MTRVSLQFSQPMDPGTVEGRLVLEPEQAGRLYWDGQAMIFEPDIPWPAGLSVTVTLQAGARGMNKLPMLGSRTWSFKVGEASLVYLWPGEGKSELYRLSLDGSEPLPLTHSDRGIQEFSIRADGAILVYSAAAPAGGTELHELDLISEADRLLIRVRTGNSLRARRRFRQTVNGSLLNASNSNSEKQGGCSQPSAEYGCCRWRAEVRLGQ